MTMHVPQTSIVVCAFNMERELPRTLQSLSPAMQHGVSSTDYEIIVMDNGSATPVEVRAVEQGGVNVRVIRLPPESMSPARALNRGIAAARGELIGVLVDGARIASPGVVALARLAHRLSERVVSLTLGFHLGTEVQMESVPRGYNQDEEDQLLTASGWAEDGYRLFDISIFAGSSNGGWFKPITESNALFMHRDLWHELGGYDERFQTPGGGFVNLDTFARAVELPEVTMVTLLGEGTFHQVHGGAATSTLGVLIDRFQAEYLNVRGKPYTPPSYETLYFGRAHPSVLPSIEGSAGS